VYSSDSARIRKANAESASHFQFMSGLSPGIVGLLPVILSEAERWTISLTLIVWNLNRHINWSWASSIDTSTGLGPPQQTHQLVLGLLSQTD